MVPRAAGGLLAGKHRHRLRLLPSLREPLRGVAQGSRSPGSPRVGRLDAGREVACVMKKLLRSSVNAIPGPLRGWIKHIPGVAASQRWVVYELLAGEAFIHTVNSGPATGL